MNRRSLWRSLTAASACVSLLLAVTAPARAEEPSADAWSEAHHLKLVGAAMSGVGFGLNAIGGGLLIAGLTLPDSCVFAIGGPEEGPCSPGASSRQLANAGVADSLFGAGIALSLVGDVVMLVGLPVWGIGAKRERALHRHTASADGTFRF